MSQILKILDQKFSDKCYIDVEMNSLEDAYINIAKEEEKLVRNLNAFGIKRQSSETELEGSGLTDPLIPRVRMNTTENNMTEEP